jgi:hypothetical protein
MVVQKEKTNTGARQPNSPSARSVSKNARSLPAVRMQKVDGSGNQSVIQRKVGLEFESQNQVIEVGGEPNLLFNKKSIGKGKGFDVIGDEAKLEVVSDAVDETEEGKKALFGQVAGIADFVGSLQKGENKISEIDGITLSEDAKKTIANIKLPTDANSLPFHPQATAGVRLMAVSDLMNAFLNAPLKGVKDKAWTDDNDGNVESGQKPHKYAENLGWDGRHNYPAMQMALQTANQEIEDQAFDSPKVKSLFQLGLSYAISVDSVKKSQEHTEAKFWMSFMSRSKLSEVYQTLTREEQDEFGDKLEKMKKNFTKRNFFESGGMGKGSDLVFYDDRNWHSWMEGFGKRKDEIQECGSTGYGEIEGSSHKYDMKTPSDIGISDLSDRRRMDGVVLELRSLGANVTPPSFPSFGLNVFELIRSVHQKYENDTSGLEEKQQKKKKTNTTESLIEISSEGILLDGPSKKNAAKENNEEDGCGCKCIIQ